MIGAPVDFNIGGEGGFGGGRRMMPTSAPVALPPGTQKTTTSAKDKAAQAAVAKAKAKANPKDVANTST